MPHSIEEKDEAMKLANKLLDEPYADPDDSLRLLARQFLRQIERTEQAYTQGKKDGIANTLRDMKELSDKAPEGAKIDFEYYAKETLKKLFPY